MHTPFLTIYYYYDYYDKLVETILLLKDSTDE